MISHSLSNTHSFSYTLNGNTNICTRGLRHIFYPDICSMHIIATPFPNEWHKIGDNMNTVHYPTVEKLNKIFRLFVAEYLQLEQVNLWDEAEDGGIVKDDTRTNAKINSKHTPTTSGGAPSIKMHTEFWSKIFFIQIKGPILIHSNMNFH